MTDPRPVLERRLADRRARVATLDRRDAGVARARLGVFAAAAVIAWLAFASRALSAWWLLAPAAGFVALLVAHDRVFRARDGARRAVTFHEAALARIDGTFAGRGEGGERFVDPEHPYAADLDLFGRGSLFELLCGARTAAGEARLAGWLLAPAAAPEVRARQAAVQELSPRLDLREDLAVLGEDVRSGVEPASLATWAEARPLLAPWVPLVAVLLAAAGALATAAWAMGSSGWYLAAVLVADWGFARTQRDALARVLGGLGRPAAELEVLSLLLARLVREPFQDVRLTGLTAALGAGGTRAHEAITALERIATRTEWAKNQFFAPLGFVLQWVPLHAALVERWRRAHGRAVRGWLEAVAELEALSSLAGYAYEHPSDTWPEVAEAAPGGAFVRGEAVRHPLLPGAVANPVALGGDGPPVLLVSGSNMSGKSTYLRTVGVNVVLALAGAPVRAARFALAPVQAGATLRIQDSLQAGKSRFYAEITRLKLLADLARGPFPLLFLLDEILHGTNSHDRRIGAAAILRGLASAGAIGLVTTHDLALTELAGGETPGGLGNAHFEDQLKDGEIAFDYRLRPGVVAHSNALALMRAVGLQL